MLGLDLSLSILLIVCLLAACAFEFINGFHDTANAVATVIYTKSLKPVTAVVWSAICNFAGVFFGGIAVAMGIVNLLPVESLIDQNVHHSIAMVLALIFTAILWNLGTWYYGIPCSSSHTLIGSILGVGLAFSLLPGNTGGAAVNWSKAYEIGLSLLISPMFGFSATIFLMFLLKRLTRNPKLFKEPNKHKPPPWWIRGILLFSCTGVSFSHGSNDGQKGVGLIMLILIGVVPTYFALDNSKDPRAMEASLSKVKSIVFNVNAENLSGSETRQFNKVKASITSLEKVFQSTAKFKDLPENRHFIIRKEVLIASRTLERLMASEDIRLSGRDVSILKRELAYMRQFTDYAPTWVLIMVAVSLGMGTMIGWRRIVTTIGEKIGKQHLTYAQGASAEVVAATTVGVSSWLGLPVSTTHVLSSGIAGGMVAGRGIKNLQAKTIKNIMWAWVLTLPVCIVMSGALFLIFRWIL